MGWLVHFAVLLQTKVSSAWNAAKEVAGKAIGWMAEKAEGFVGAGVIEGVGVGQTPCG